MASIRTEVSIATSAKSVWDAMRDVANVHKRVVPGFVTDCRMEGEARVVTFFNGMVAKELIVDVDDKAMRLVWSARSERLQHHNASVQVIDEGKGQDGSGRCRVVWIADVLPHEAAKVVGAMMEKAMPIMKKTLEAGTSVS
jgi:polyketide cyclase/dehydrase/lipid transport protein